MAVIALVFTFAVRIVQVDGSSMNPSLYSGERLLIATFLQPDYGDVVVTDSYIPYGKPLVKRVIGESGGYHRYRFPDRRCVSERAGSLGTVYGGTHLDL